MMKVLNFSMLWFLTGQIGCRVHSGLVSEGKQLHFYEVVPWSAFRPTGPSWGCAIALQWIEGAQETESHQEEKTLFALNPAAVESRNCLTPIQNAPSMARSPSPSPGTIRGVSASLSV